MGECINGEYTCIHTPADPRQEDVFICIYMLMRGKKQNTHTHIYIYKSPAGNPATVPRLVVGSGWCVVVVVCLWCLVFGVVV